jgi:hypothetical protein
MVKYLSAVCSGKTVQELEQDINDSIALEEESGEGQLIEVINVSLSSFYDFKEGTPIHTAVVLWSYVPIKQMKKKEKN